MFIARTANVYARVEPELIPFEIKLPRTTPLAYGFLTEKEIEKGMADVKAGRVYSANAIEKQLNDN